MVSNRSNDAFAAAAGKVAVSSPWAADVAQRERIALEAVKHGGEESVARHRSRGRLPLRERIHAVLDPGSFQEVGPMAGGSERDPDTGELRSFTPGNFILGTGTVDGRRVVVGGEDFTIKGGSPNVAGLRKSVYTEELALKYRLPLVRLHEGGGGAVGGGHSAPPPVFGTPRFKSVAECLGLVPVVTAALGAVAGLPASRFVASHFNVAVESAQILTAGPKVVERALGYETTKDELGGRPIHEASGVVDNFVKDEAEAFRTIRRFLSYLPSNVYELPPPSARRSGGNSAGGIIDEDPRGRAEEELMHIIPQNRRQVYDVRRLIELVVDRETVAEAAGAGKSATSATTSSWFEMGTSHFGRGIVCGMARLDGRPLGIFANDPRFYAGAMTWDAAQKLRRFLEFCETFHLPVLSVLDEPGFMVGVDAERAGTIRYGTAAVLSAQTATVPWCVLHVRKAYGVAAAAHFGPDADVYAWPSAEAGTLPVESGVAVMFGRQLAEADDPEALRKELEEK